MGSEEMMNVFIPMINSVGFPIFVAVFMLLKGSKDTKELKASVGELTKAVELQTKLIELIVKTKKEGE